MKFGTPAATEFIKQASEFKKSTSGKESETQYASLTDVLLPEKVTEFKSKSYQFGTRMADAEEKIQKFIPLLCAENIDEFIKQGSDE